MKIETKYNIGDKVIILANDKYLEVCPFCNGKEFLTISGEKYYCQNCDDGIITCKKNTKMII